LWSELVKHAKDNFSDQIGFYNVWHEPSYAHFREFSSKEPDYSKPELKEYNQWRKNLGKNTVDQIPNPIDQDYTTFRKWNLASLLNNSADAIRVEDPKAKVAFHMFMAGQEDVEKINEMAVDPNILMAVIKPDIINYHIAGEWNKVPEGFGMTPKEIFELGKEYGITKKPLLTSGLNPEEEAQLYNARYLNPLNIHMYRISTGQDMPLTNCWASVEKEQEWNSNNSLRYDNALAAAYTSEYQWLYEKGSFPDQVIGGLDGVEFYASNTGKKTWKKSEGYTLGLNFVDEKGNRLVNEDGQEITYRAQWAGGDDKVFPGEQQKFVFRHISLPEDFSGTYNFEVDMMQEGVTWFSWQGSEVYAQDVEVASQKVVIRNVIDNYNGYFEEADINLDDTVNSLDFSEIIQWSGLTFNE
jgi:hypothetical protein